MRKIFVALFVILGFTMLFLGFAGAVVKAEAADSNSWASKSRMPTERFGLGAADANGLVYAIGGTHYAIINGVSTPAPTSANEAYDPTTDTWRTKTPLPTPITNFGIATYQNKIYCIGGTTNEVYDPEKDVWQLLTPMITPRTDLQANAVGGKIYLIGGNNATTVGPSQISNLNEVYDPTTDAWTTKSPLPSAVSDYASTIVNGRIYIISGRSQSGLSDAVQVYDPQSDSWSNIASIPTPVQGAAASLIPDTYSETNANGVQSTQALFVIGGTIQSDPIHATNLTQVYSPQTNIWTNGTSILYPESELAAVSMNTTIFAIGGGQNAFFNPQSNLNQQYGPNITQNLSNSLPTLTPVALATLAPSPTPTPSITAPPLSFSPSSNPSPSIPELPSVMVLLSLVVAATVILGLRHMSSKNKNQG